MRAPHLGRSAGGCLPALPPGAYRPRRCSLSFYQAFRCLAAILFILTSKTNEQTAILSAGMFLGDHSEVYLFTPEIWNDSARKRGALIPHKVLREKDPTKREGVVRD